MWKKIFEPADWAGVGSHLLLIVTFGGLMGMDAFVGADWPEWRNMMVVVGIFVLPAAWVLVLIGLGAAPVGRWIALAAVLVAILRLLWVVYDSGAIPTLAVVPMLVVLCGVAVFLVYTWPKAASRELKELAWRLRGALGEVALAGGAPLPVERVRPAPRCPAADPGGPARFADPLRHHAGER
ncbi:hypothetical protein GCM10029976_087790 [Kribbella albertanoniae]